MKISSPPHSLKLLGVPGMVALLFVMTCKVSVGVQALSMERIENYYICCNLYTYQSSISDSKKMTEAGSVWHMMKRCPYTNLTRGGWRIVGEASLSPVFSLNLGFSLQTSSQAEVTETHKPLWDTHPHKCRCPFDWIKLPRSFGRFSNAHTCALLKTVKLGRKKVCLFPEPPKFWDMS